jgi:hypothetical protein
MEQQVTSKQYQRHQRKQLLRCIGQAGNRRCVDTHDGCWWFLEGLTDCKTAKMMAEGNQTAG